MVKVPFVVPLLRRRDIGLILADVHRKEPAGIINRDQKKNEGDRDMNTRGSDGNSNEGIGNTYKWLGLGFEPLAGFSEVQLFQNCIETLGWDQLFHWRLDKVRNLNEPPILRLDVDFIQALEIYPWGGFEELDSVLRASICASERGTLRFSDLPNWYLKRLVRFTSEVLRDDRGPGGQSGQTGLNYVPLMGAQLVPSGQKSPINGPTNPRM